MTNLLSKRIKKVNYDVKGYSSTCDNQCVMNCYDACNNTCTGGCRGLCGDGCEGSCGNFCHRVVI